MISLGEFILLSLIVLSAVLATVYLNRKLKEKGYRVNNLLNVLVVLTVSTALCLVGTSVAWILKGVAFALILLYASVEDFTKREADDCLWVMILLLSALPMQADSACGQCLAAALLPLFPLFP